MHKILIVFCTCILLQACAKRPGSISATPLPSDTYAGRSCAEIASDLASEKSTLSTLSKRQHDAATGDAFGVFMIGLPIASMAGGDREAKISISKGRIDALTLAAARKGCT